MITIRRERPTDVVAREALLDLSFGQCRFDKTSERLREGRLPADGLSFVAVEGGRQEGRIVGTVRLWHVSTGAGRPALLLGPLAVSPDRRNRGIGASLIRRALRDARRFGHGAMIRLPGAPVLLGCYHVSQQNTNTGKLTPKMIDRVLAQATRLTR